MVPRSSGPFLPAAFLFLKIDGLDALARKNLDRREQVEFGVHSAGGRIEFGRRHQQPNGQRGRLRDRHLSWRRVAPLFEEMQNALDAAGARPRTCEGGSFKLGAKRIVKINTRTG